MLAVTAQAARTRNDREGCGVLRRTAMRVAAFLLALAAPVLAAPAGAPDPVYAEGQAEADYHAWLARSPSARAEVIAFNQFLGFENVDDVLPTWQLVRTASDWRQCAGPRFEVAPFAEWQHIAATLRFVKRHVRPVIGDVEALSGYRNPALNACARGAPESAHRRFYALDLTPVKPIGRDAMIRSLCAIHRFRGADYDAGLGFYSGRRFHVDSKGFRTWGPDGTGATSPCNA